MSTWDENYDLVWGIIEELIVDENLNDYKQIICHKVIHNQIEEC